MIPEPGTKTAAPKPTTNPFDSGSWPISDDPRVVRVLEAYMADVQAGRRPSREEMLERHPEIAKALGECLDGLDFLRSAAKDISNPDRAAGPRDSIAPATCLGDYRIVREVGRGGMGVVYEAEQISLGRRVALKVLPFASAIDPKQRQRFQVEAQAAAHLHHPHIVPIFAVGEAGGSHFYAMPFIEGKTLAAIIQESRRLGGISRGEAFLASRLVPKETAVEVFSDDAPPTASLEFNNERPKTHGMNGSGSSQKGRAYYRAVARLGIEAAGALEHAHGLGVLHRDIKPANLLIDLQGKLWVADFGLARFRDDPGPTRTGDLLGTLRYMSPEQIEARRGVVDQRADIYALGATLYEALTLRPAFSGRDRHEILQRILNDDPPRPRKLDPAIPRDLETILLKAMAKSHSVRYGTAQELADDLQRFLEDRAILACPPTPIEHAVRWVRKRRALVATAALVMVMATVVGSVLILAEQKKTSDALVKTTKALKEAEAHIALTKSGLEVMDFALLASHNITMSAIGVVTEFGTGALTKQNRRFFGLAQNFYEGVEQRLRDDPAPSRREMLGKAYFGLGLTRFLLGQPESEDAYYRSIEVYESLVAQQPNRADLKWHLAASLKYLAMKQAAEPSPLESELTYRRLVKFEQAILDESPGTPSQYDSLHEDTVNWARQLCECGHSEESEQVLLGLLGIRPDHGMAMNNLAWLLSSEPDRQPFDPKRASDLARKAVKLHPEVYMYWNTLGMALLRAGEYTEAIQALRKSIELCRSACPHDWFMLSMVHTRLGQNDEASADYRKGLDLMKKMRPEADMAALRDEAAEALGVRKRTPTKSKPKLKLKSMPEDKGPFVDPNSQPALMPMSMPENDRPIIDGPRGQIPRRVIAN